MVGGSGFLADQMPVYFYNQEHELGNVGYYDDVLEPFISIEKSVDHNNGRHNCDKKQKQTDSSDLHKFLLQIGDSTTYLTNGIGPRVYLQRCSILYTR